MAGWRDSGAPMAWIPGGVFLMGSDGFSPHERPAHRATVDGFWMDERLVIVPGHAPLHDVHPIRRSA